MELVIGFTTDLNFTLKKGNKTIKQYSNNQMDVAAKTAMKIFNEYSFEHTFETKIKMACLNGLLILIGGDACDKAKMCCNKIWDGYQEACQFYSEQEKVVNPPKDDFTNEMRRRRSRSLFIFLFFFYYGENYALAQAAP